MIPLALCMARHPIPYAEKSLHTCFILGGSFGYFFNFFLLGEGEGGVRGAGRGGVVSLLKIPQGGGGLEEGEGPAGCLRRLGDFFGGVFKGQHD